jgi:hypothetical protein
MHKCRPNKEELPMSGQLRFKFAPLAAVLAVATLVGCATSAPPNSAPAAVVSAPPPVDRHDSVRRFEQMDRVAMQIVRGTASTTEEDYQARVRPQLSGPLQRLGFSREEIGQIFTRVDDARADRQRVRRWWAGVTGSAEPTSHARR